MLDSVWNFRLLTTGNYRRCGAENIPLPDLIKFEGEFQNQRVVTNETSGSWGPINIDMYIHVIAVDGTTGGGNVS